MVKVIEADQSDHRSSDRGANGPVVNNAIVDSPGKLSLDKVCGTLACEGVDHIGRVKTVRNSTVNVEDSKEFVFICGLDEG